MGVVVPQSVEVPVCPECDRPMPKLSHGIGVVTLDCEGRSPRHFVHAMTRYQRDASNRWRWTDLSIQGKTLFTCGPQAVWWPGALWCAHPSSPHVVEFLMRMWKATHSPAYPFDVKVLLYAENPPCPPPELVVGLRTELHEHAETQQRYETGPTAKKSPLDVVVSLGVPVLLHRALMVEGTSAWAREVAAWELAQWHRDM